MKNILPFLLLSLFAASCQKDSGKRPASLPSDGKSYSVKFNVSGVKSSMAASKKTTNGLGVNDINTHTVEALYYFVYDDKGRFIHRFFQDSSTANFGSVKDQLPSGHYTIAIFAGGKNVSYEAVDSGEEVNISKATLIQPGGWSDSFYKTFTIDVDKVGVNQDVVLERVTGKLSIKFLDAIPPKAKKLTIVHGGFAPFKLAAPPLPIQSYEIMITVPLPASAIGKTDFTISTFAMPFRYPQDVKIKCYDAEKKLISDVIVRDVVVERNRHTLLSGNLFGADNDYSIGVDQSWDLPINVDF